MHKGLSLLITMVAIVGVLAGPGDVVAQRQPQAGVHSDPRLRYGSVVYAEAACFPSDSAGLARVDVLVRVSYDFMIFTRRGGADPDSQYIASADIIGNLRQNGVTVRSQHTVIHAAVADYDATILRDRYQLVRQTFLVAPGPYDVLMEISDKGSTRNTIVRQRLRAVALDADRFGIGAPIPLRMESRDGRDVFSVLGYGRTLAFAERSLVGVPVPRDLDAAWQVRLLRAGDDEVSADDHRAAEARAGDETEDAMMTGEVVFDGTIQPTAVLTGAVPSGVPGMVPDFQLQISENARGALVVLELPFQEFDVGRYRLLVRATQGDRTDTVVIPIEIFWRDMPFSMRDLEFAVDAMRFILTREEYDEMKSGSERERQRAFRRYWNKQDHTPETEHNEMMAEYFRRVDQAYYKFQTLYIGNGVQTDRGKVYVLFGPPEETHRIMALDEPVTEIWDYPSIGKTFRFVDTSRDGNLRLLEE